MRTSLLTLRVGFALPALACAALLGFGYYLQYVEGLDPCPLCLVQRGFFYAVAGTCMIASIHAPRGWGRTAYGLVALENVPLSRVLKTLITGTGECAVVDWTFLGLSIAEWSLGCFVALFVYALWLALRRPKAAAAADMTFPEVEGKFR
jgi:disulfide bond formation protein DsbB